MMLRVLIVVLLLTPFPLYAYVGPGSGLSAIGSLLALIGVVLLFLLGFVWYPVKRLIKARSGEADESGETGKEKREPDEHNE